LGSEGGARRYDCGIRFQTFTRIIA
jgi:hypothetical protein